MIVKLTEKSEALIAGQETLTMKMAKEPEERGEDNTEEKSEENGRTGSE